MQLPLRRTCQGGGIAARQAHVAVASRLRRRVMLAAAAAVSGNGSGLTTEQLCQLWEQHIETEFTEKSADAAVATMVPHATVNHVPVQTGGEGTAALREFYATHFIPTMPADVVIEPLARTVGKDTKTGGDMVVDEFVFNFTHSVQMDWMLPGLAPTGKAVSVPFVVCVAFEGNKLLAERIWWDQATVLKQLGLLPPGLDALVSGTEQASKARDKTSVPSNQKITAAAAAAAKVAK